MRLIIGLVFLIGACSAGRKIREIREVCTLEGRIVFASIVPGENPPRNHQLYIMNADGGDLYPVPGTVFANRRMGHPFWFRDGQRIYFPAGDTLYVISIDGSDLTIVYGTDSSKGSVSPKFGLGWGIAFLDSLTKIAFVSGNYELWEFTIETGELRQLIDGLDLCRRNGLKKFYISNPSYSPDGNRIVFCGVEERVLGSRISESYGLFILRTGDLDLRKVLEVDASGSLRWSPDGKRIAFSTEDGVYVTDLDGSGTRRITTRRRRPLFSSYGAYYSPCWSADGTKLMYIYTIGAQVPLDALLDREELHVINMDGTGDKVIVSCKGREWERKVCVPNLFDWWSGPLKAR